MTADTANGPACGPALRDATVRKTVLIIEDDRAFRDLLALHISAAGYKALVAEDAVAGGTLLLSAKPDLLLLDILLPYMGGLELLEALRHDPDVGHTPVICVTSLRDDATFIKAKQLGAAAILTKPLRGEELLATVARVLQGAPEPGGKEAAR